MKENIVQKLTSKDDKYACAFTDRIVAESHDTDENLQKGQTMKKDVMIVTDAGRIGMALATRMLPDASETCCFTCDLYLSGL